MTSPDPTAANSPSSGYFSAGTTLTNSGPECAGCSEIWLSLSPPDKERYWPSVPVKDLKQPCHGYPALANLMFNNPGFQSFQAFRDLHIKSLLYYQVKLDTIRNELHKLEWEDHCKGTFEYHEKLSINPGFLVKDETYPGARGTSSAATVGNEGSEGVEAAEEGKNKQICKVEEMRKVLKDYSKKSLQLPLRSPSATPANPNRTTR
jgi:hypothetical protein